MKLYRIRRKSDGKYFGGLAYPWHPKGHEKWNDKGAFFHDIDTIADWLKVLCVHWKNLDDEVNKSICGRWKASRLVKFIADYDRAKLKEYEVIVNNVTVNGEEVLEAIELVK